MADGTKVEIELDQATLDKGHKMLDRLVGMTERARVRACNEGQTELRDTLERGGAYLRLARAEFGGIVTDGGIRPRSGDK